MPQTFSTFNQRAATASSFLAAAAVVIAAAITVVSIRSEAAVLPNGPRELAFAADGAAPAATESVGYETEDIRRRAEPALNEIVYDWARNLDGWQIQFLGPNGNIAGYTWSEERMIEVFVKDDADSARLTRILAHEIGHAVDVTLNTGDERREWLKQRSADSSPWWPSSGAADFQTGAGDFAEVFAAWEVGTEDYRSEVAPVPTTSDFDLLQRLAAG